MPDFVPISTFTDWRGFVVPDIVLIQQNYCHSCFNTKWKYKGSHYHWNCSVVFIDKHATSDQADYI